MSARADAAERTMDRIHDTAIELFRSRPFGEVTLQAIAEASGVTLQTVLRRFGSKENVFTSAAKIYTERIFATRVVEESSDVSTIIRTLIASYEEMGDLNWRGVSQEDQFPSVKAIFDQARARHREWVEARFADVIRQVPVEQRESAVLLLFAATDFYVWKLYRRDLGQSRTFTTAQMTETVNALVERFRRQS